jgi:hypothetical protein
MANNATAEWWTDPGSKGDEVVAHTPDDTKYHYPDEKQLDHLHGRMGVMIPRANDDGTSKGFYGGEAGVVHVDPDAPDGGVVVDLSRMGHDRYYNAFAQSHYPHEVFYRLGQRPTAVAQAMAAPPAPSRANSVVPAGSYIVPASDQFGKQLQPAMATIQEIPTMQPVPPLPIPQPLQEQPMAQQPAQIPMSPMPQAQPAYVSPPQQITQPTYAVPPQQQYVPPVAPPTSPELYAMQQQMAQMANVVNSLAHAVQAQQPQQPTWPAAPAAAPQLRTLPQPSRTAAPAPAPATIPHRQRRAMEPADEAEWEPQQTLAEVQAKANVEEQGDRLIIGFETLELPFVNGPVPQKAKKQVFFSIPSAQGTLGGTMHGRYHAICEGKECLALVYDTRYTDGQIYIPPDLGAETEVNVTIPQGKNKPAKEYLCYSMGFHFQLGVFDVVLLVKTPEAAQEFADDEVEYEEEPAPPPRRRVPAPRLPLQRRPMMPPPPQEFPDE